MEEPFSHIITKHDVIVLERELDVLLESIYKSPGFEETLKTQVRKDTASGIEEVVKDADIEKTLRKLKKKLEEMEFVQITIAFDPSSENISKLSDWVKNNIDKNILIDLRVRPYIVAGATISYKGKYADYTLTKVFSENFTSIKGDIAKLILGESTSTKVD